MKVTIQQETGCENEVIIRYDKLTPEVDRIIQYVQSGKPRIVGKIDDRTVMLDIAKILYIETVDDKTFAYTTSEVVRLEASLTRLIEDLNDIRFFRCSKSMIININKVASLKSLSSNRIDATMKNGEHIIISRTYATEFRKILKGGGANEE